MASQAADALSLTLGMNVRPEDVEVEASFGDGGLAATIDDACEQRREAERAAESAGAATLDAIIAAVDAGLAQRDIGALLGVLFPVRVQGVGQTP